MSSAKEIYLAEPDDSCNGDEYFRQWAIRVAVNIKLSPKFKRSIEIKDYLDSALAAVQKMYSAGVAKQFLMAVTAPCRISHLVATEAIKEIERIVTSSLR